MSFDAPYQNTPGGNPFPIPAPSVAVPFPAFGAFETIDPDINSPRVQTWNVTIEQQIGERWQASASYLGSHMDRLWNQVGLNPGLFMGLGPCTIQGVSYPSCTVAGNLDQRRLLYQENPREAAFLGPVDRHTAIGTQDCRGLKLSFRRRALTGVTFSGNYTLSHCVGNSTPSGFPQISAGYLKPDDPDFDRGNCFQNWTHVGNLTVGFQTPECANTTLRTVASDWRITGIVGARSGSWLPVTTARDIAGSGIASQRLNQVLENPYGAKTIANYPAAFAYPAAGTLGDHTINSIENPGFRTVDVAVSKLIPLGAAQNIELRMEAFNVLNTFTLGSPVTNYDVGTFGQITTMSGDPRIIQLAVKYAF